MSEYWDRIRIGEFLRRGFKGRGVVHIGANDGYETQFYLKLGLIPVMLFEPLPEAYRLIQQHYPQEEVLKYNFCLSNYVGKSKFYVTDGDGQGSSLLDLTEDYLREHPEYDKPIEIEVPVNTFANIVEGERIDLSVYNILCIDTQGSELEVLKGMGEYLNYFEALNIEVSKIPVYKGASGQEIVNYLDNFRPLTPIPVHNDMLFIKRGLMENIQEFKIE